MIYNSRNCDKWSSVILHTIIRVSMERFEYHFVQTLTLRQKLDHLFSTSRLLPPQHLSLILISCLPWSSFYPGAMVTGIHEDSAEAGRAVSECLSICSKYFRCEWNLNIKDQRVHLQKQLSPFLIHFLTYALQRLSITLLSSYFYKTPPRCLLSLNLLFFVIVQSKKYQSNRCWFVHFQNVFYVFADKHWDWCILCYLRTIVPNCVIYNIIESRK